MRNDTSHYHYQQYFHSNQRTFSVVLYTHSFVHNSLSCSFPAVLSDRAGVARPSPVAWTLDLLLNCL